MTPDASSLAYKPGWTFKVAKRADGDRLCIFATTPDSLSPSRARTTQHMHVIPADVLADERTWARWVFARLLDAERHEAAEFFQVDGFRPFWPHHQDEGSPYEPVERWDEQCP